MTKKFLKVMLNLKIHKLIFYKASPTKQVHSNISKETPSKHLDIKLVEFLHLLIVNLIRESKQHAVNMNCNCLNIRKL